MSRLDLYTHCAASPLVLSIDDNGMWTIRHKHDGFVWECVDRMDALQLYRKLRHNWLAMFRDETA